MFLSVIQVTNLSASMSEAELRARAAAEHGLPLTQHMLSGTIPMYPSLLGKLHHSIPFHLVLLMFSGVELYEDTLYCTCIYLQAK